MEVDTATTIDSKIFTQSDGGTIVKTKRGPFAAIKIKPEHFRLMLDFLSPKDILNL